MSQSIGFPIHNFHFRSDSIFEGLPDEELDFLKSVMTIKKYQRNKMLFVEGSFPSGIFYLIEGKVKKFKVDKDGREQIIYVCNSGEVLGYPALLGEETYSDSATAIEDAVVGFVTKEDFLSLLDRSSVLARQLLKNLSHEFAVLENNILSMAHKTVRERLALSLLILRDKYKDKNGVNDKIEIVLSRENLSNIVGTAAETLARLLREFKNEGLIETEKRKIRILNAKALVKIANL